MKFDKIRTQNSVARAMMLVSEYARYVAKGDERVCYFSGPPGVGKSRAIREAISHFRRQGREPIYCNPADYRALLGAFKKAARGNRPIICEEADVIFTSQRMINILKLATSDNPSERVYEGIMLASPLLISTNRDLSDPTLWPRDQQIHIEALFNRVPPVIIPNDPYNLWEYSVWLAACHGLVANNSRGDGISLHVTVAAIDWFTGNAKGLTTVSPRTLQKIADWMSWIENPDILMSRLNTLLRDGEQMQPPEVIADWRAIILEHQRDRRSGLQKNTCEVIAPLLLSDNRV